MKRYAILVPVALASLLAAQQGGGPVIQDKEGKRIKFEGWRNIKTLVQKDGTISVRVVPDPGGTVRGVWMAERTTITAGEINALITKDYQLVRATLSAGIGVDATRPSTVAGSFQTIDVNASSGTYTHANREVKIDGKFSVVRTDKGAGESLSASGDGGGTVNLSESGSSKNALQRAELRGPINFAMSGRRTDEGKQVPFKLDGRGDRLNYDAATRTVILSGNVRLSGDDPSLAGDMRGINKAIITLDEGGEIESIELEGTPGETSISQKEKVPPPTRRR